MNEGSSYENNNYMIIGNGLIATLFLEHDCSDVIFFASGVSNSLSTDREAFLREEDTAKTVIAKYPDKLFVYFSTASVYDASKKDSLYVCHKLNMERLVQVHCRHYLILRVSNAIGKSNNPHLLLNYLATAIREQKMIEVQANATRNFIDVEDVKNLTLSLLASGVCNTTVNIAYLQSFPVIEIVREIEKILDLNAKINRVDKGDSYDISLSDSVKDYFIQRKLNNAQRYLTLVLSKYLITGQ